MGKPGTRNGVSHISEFIAYDEETQGIETS